MQQRAPEMCIHGSHWRYAFSLFWARADVACRWSGVCTFRSVLSIRSGRACGLGSGSALLSLKGPAV